MQLPRIDTLPIGSRELGRTTSWNEYIKATKTFFEDYFEKIPAGSTLDAGATQVLADNIVKYSNDLDGFIQALKREAGRNVTDITVVAERVRANAREEINQIVVDKKILLTVGTRVIPAENLRLGRYLLLRNELLQMLSTGTLVGNTLEEARELNEAMRSTTAGITSNKENALFVDDMEQILRLNPVLKKEQPKKITLGDKAKTELQQALKDAGFPTDDPDIALQALNEALKTTTAFQGSPSLPLDARIIPFFEKLADSLDKRIEDLEGRDAGASLLKFAGAASAASAVLELAELTPLAALLKKMVVGERNRLKSPTDPISEFKNYPLGKELIAKWLREIQTERTDTSPASIDFQEYIDRILSAPDVAPADAEQQLDRFARMLTNQIGIEQANIPNLVSQDQTEARRLSGFAQVYLNEWIRKARDARRALGTRNTTTPSTTSLGSAPTGSPAPPIVDGDRVERLLQTGTIWELLYYLDENPLRKSLDADPLQQRWLARFNVLLERLTDEQEKKLAKLFLAQHDLYALSYSNRDDLATKFSAVYNEIEGFSAFDPKNVESLIGPSSRYGAEVQAMHDYIVERLRDPNDKNSLYYKFFRTAVADGSFESKVKQKIQAAFPNFPEYVFKLAWKYFQLGDIVTEAYMLPLAWSASRNHVAESGKDQALKYSPLAMAAYNINAYPAQTDRSLMMLTLFDRATIDQWLSPDPSWSQPQNLPLTGECQTVIRNLPRYKEKVLEYRKLAMEWMKCWYETKGVTEQLHLDRGELFLPPIGEAVRKKWVSTQDQYKLVAESLDVMLEELFKPSELMTAIEVSKKFGDWLRNGIGKAKLLVDDDRKFHKRLIVMTKMYLFRLIHNYVWNRPQEGLVDNTYRRAGEMKTLFRLLLSELDDPTNIDTVASFENGPGSRLKSLKEEISTWLNGKNFLYDNQYAQPFTSHAKWEGEYVSHYQRLQQADVSTRLQKSVVQIFVGGPLPTPYVVADQRKETTQQEKK